MIKSQDVRASVGVQQARQGRSRQDMADYCGISVKSLDSRLRRCAEDQGTFWMLLKLAQFFNVPASELLAEAESISQQEQSNAK